MPLKEPLMIKTVLGNTDFSLEARSGESILIKDIRIYNPATSYLTAKTDKTTVAYFRIGGVLGNHLSFPFGAAKHAHDWKTSATAAGDQTSFVGLVNSGGTEIAAKMIGGLAASTTYRRVGELGKSSTPSLRTILALLQDKGLFVGYPLGEGETFTLTGAKQAGAIQQVLYEVYDAADIKPELPNGSKSKEYLYINYGNAGASINTDGDNLISTAKNPVEFPAFPYGSDVPSKTKVTLLAILASDFSPKENDGTDYCFSKFLKFVRDRITLFDDDKQGLLLYNGLATGLGNLDSVAEGQSQVGNFSDVDTNPPFFFPVALDFESGEELNIYYTITKGASGKDIAIDEHEIGVIVKVIRGE